MQFYSCGVAPQNAQDLDFLYWGGCGCAVFGSDVTVFNTVFNNDFNHNVDHFSSFYRADSVARAPSSQLTLSLECRC